VYYLSASEVVQINDEVTEGHAAIRDLHLLDSALLRPAIVVFGQPQFPTVTEKAAALMESLAYHHLFYDGNKRTAIRAVALFLERNGLRFDYVPARDADFILAIAKGEKTLEDIAMWIGAHTEQA
jgi:death on curing protein